MAVLDRRKADDAVRRDHRRERASISRSSRGRSSPSSARTGPARRPSSTPSPASTSRPRAECCSRASRSRRPFTWKVGRRARSRSGCSRRCWSMLFAVNVDALWKAAIADNYREDRPVPVAQGRSPTPRDHIAARGRRGRRGFAIGLAHRRGRHARRVAAGAARAGRHHAGRHRPHVPEHPPVPGHDRARERPGRHDRRSRAPVSARPRHRREEASAKAASCSRSSASPGKHNELAKNLPYGDQRRLEIARALATEPEAPAARRTGRRHEPERDRRPDGRSSARSATAASRCS